MIKDFLTAFPTTLEISKNRTITDISTLINRTETIDNFETFTDVNTGIDFVAFTISNDSTNVYFANLPISALIEKYNDYISSINEDFSGITVTFVKINSGSENEYITINFI